MVTDGNVRGQIADKHVHKEAQRAHDSKPLEDDAPRWSPGHAGPWGAHRRCHSRPSGGGCGAGSDVGRPVVVVVLFSQFLFITEKPESHLGCIRRRRTT